MWKCHKCGKPVYFAERQQSLGYDWHPECLRCEECGKRLNPGLHAEHKGVPYCHVPCYGALFGPQLFGHGTRVESHKSFGDKQAAGAGVGGGAGGGAAALARSVGPQLPRDHIESRLRVYNQHQSNNGSHEIRCREVNERLVLEGALRVSWGVQGMIHLKEDDDQRTVVTVRKRNSCRYQLSEVEQQQQPLIDDAVARNDDDYYHDPEPADEAALDLNGCDIIAAAAAAAASAPPPLNTATYNVHAGGTGGSDSTDISESMSYDTCSLMATSQTADDHTSAGSSMSGSPEHQPLLAATSPQSGSRTLPGRVDQIAALQWDELDELLQVERLVDDAHKPYQTMPNAASTISSASSIASLSQSVHTADTASVGGSLASTTCDDSSRTLTHQFERCLDLSPDGSSGDSPTATNATETTGTTITSTASTTTATTETATSSSSSSEEYGTPASTLRNVDFEQFRAQVSAEYRHNSLQLQSLADGTLRSRQPIDPSRINDSLKLYAAAGDVAMVGGGGGGGAMSKSFCGAEPALRVCSPAAGFQTLRAAGQRSGGGGGGGFALQKSGSAAVAMAAGRLLLDGDSWGILNRSRSGPNWFEANGGEDGDATLKPSTIRKQQMEQKHQQQLDEVGKLQIRMDCYAEVEREQRARKQSVDPGSTVATAGNSNQSSLANGGAPRTTANANGSQSSALSTPTTETNSYSLLQPSSAATMTATSADEVTASTSTSSTTSTTVPTLNGGCPRPTADDNNDNDDDDECAAVVLRRPKLGSTAIKRRSGNKRCRAKLKRRCSINGHFYNRETSFFTPPHGSQMSVWVTSLVSTADVIQLLLEKYKVDSRPGNFALYVLRDNGEQRRLRDDEYPLVTRVMMGPHEEVARLFLMDAQSTTEISSDMAQYLNLSLPECRSIIDRFTAEQDREAQKIRDRYAELRNRIVQRMESLKVRL